MALIDEADIAYLGAKNAQTMVEDFLAEVSRFAPCLLTESADPEDLAYAKSVIRKAIERWHDMRAQLVASESAGRQNYTTRPAQLPAYATSRFTEEEKRELAALCTAPVDTAVPGLPRGSFPPAGDYGHLFARPPRDLP
ncbi:hypothetical protein GCM10027418_06600 [Mariniluteicoccus endophyticus]